MLGISPALARREISPSQANCALRGVATTVLMAD
jgi:hypothetical protein